MTSAQVQFQQAVISAAEKVALDPAVQRAARNALLEGGFVLVDGPSCQEIEGLEEDEDIQPGVPVASSEPDRLVETKTSHPQPQPIVTMKEGAIGVPSACPQVVRSPSSEPGFPFPNETQAVTQAPGILARLVAWVKSWLPSSWLQSSPQEVKAPVKDAPDLTSDRSMPLSFSNMVIGLAVSIIALALLKRSLPLKYYADLVRLLVV